MWPRPCATPGLDLPDPETAPAEALTPLVNDVVRAAGREPGTSRIIVLDDYHVITSPEVHAVVGFLVEHLPDRVRLVLATRADPPLPLARLRSRGQLCEVRAADLRFTADEAGEFLHRVMSLDLTAAEVGALESRTEGWIAGLQLAALSLRDVPDRAEVAGFIRAFTGSNRFVIDYLADEVLARRSPQEHDFLLRTAVLQRLHGPLCDAVTGGAGGARMLADLERENLFVVPLDAERSWYRYHHLFADVLHARLLAEQPDRVTDLHRRAGAWFAARGLFGDAIRHALAVDDVDRAARLIEEAVPQTRRARQDGMLQSWVRALPAPVIRRSPVLSIVSGWSRLISGDLDGAAARLDDAEAALSAGVRDPDLAAVWVDNEDLRAAPAHIAVYRASLAQGRGDVTGMVRHARHALDLAGSQDHFVRGAAGGFLGLAAWAAGDLDTALPMFERAVRSLHAAGNLVDELDGAVVLGDMSVAAGRPGHARRLYERALATATAGGPPYPRAVADLHVGLAELDRELDDLDGAEKHLESARVYGERASITENRHRWYVVAALVRAARGDHDAAGPLLDEAERRYRPGFYPDVRPIAALRARIRVAAGDLASGEAWAREAALGDEPEFLREYEHLTLARLRLAQGRPVHVLLDRLLDAATGARRAGSVREILVLQALAHRAGGDAEAGLTALDRSFTETPEPAGRIRLYRDEGERMTDLLRRAAGQDRPAASYARSLLNREKAATATDPEAPGHADGLSRREHDVLRLLATELTGPEIARRLFVSLNTFRSHTKRIFTKLGVTTRTAAVRVARDRGLL